MGDSWGLHRGRRSAFTLVEVMVGIGMAGALVLLILLLGTTAMQTDQKASDRQIASAVGESQLDVLARSAAIRSSAARGAFWSAADGDYSGPGAAAQVVSNGTKYRLTYRLETVRDASGSVLGRAGNRLRQVDLELEWWQGEEGRPGYGELSLRRTRVLRESDVRT